MFMCADPAIKVQMLDSVHAIAIGTFIKRLLEQLAQHEYWKHATVCLDSPEQLRLPEQLQQAGCYSSMYVQAPARRHHSVAPSAQHRRSWQHQYTHQCQQFHVRMHTNSWLTSRTSHSASTLWASSGGKTWLWKGGQVPDDNSGMALEPSTMPFVSSLRPYMPNIR
jgi:hypothetical protein